MQGVFVCPEPVRWIQNLSSTLDGPSCDLIYKNNEWWKCLCNRAYIWQWKASQAIGGSLSKEYQSSTYEENRTNGIHIPIPFSFDSTKVVSSNYDAAIFKGNKPMILKMLDVTNIARTSGITWIGRIFSSEVSQNKAKETTVEPSKEKEVTPSEAGESSSKKAVLAEDDREFLKIIKKNNYKFAD